MINRNELSFHNDKIMEGFNIKEKELLFSDLMEMYFHKNFGNVSKTEFETYIFSFYLEHLIDNNLPYDDYTLGRDLGITLAKVRSLKERKELKYPRKEFDWKKQFLVYSQNAKYDEKKGLIKFLIPDVNVIKYVREFFEKHNQYDEYQINPKLFQCRLDSFVEMIELLAKDNGEVIDFNFDDEYINRFLETGKLSEEEKMSLRKILSGSASDGLKEILVDSSKEVILFLLKGFVPCGGMIGSAIDLLIKVLSR